MNNNNYEKCSIDHIAQIFETIKDCNITIDYKFNGFWEGWQFGDDNNAYWTEL